jgi:hypothetical protein
MSLSLPGQICPDSGLVWVWYGITLTLAGWLAGWLLGLGEGGGGAWDKRTTPHRSAPHHAGVSTARYGR